MVSERATQTSLDKLTREESNLFDLSVMLVV